MTDPSYVRRRFTITESLNDVLTSLADEHYQGNVSLCLRAAIEDHRTTLEGTGESAPEIQRLTLEIQRANERQGDILDTLNDLSDQYEPTERSEDRSGNEAPFGLSGTQLAVYQEIAAADDGLHVKSVIERLDLPMSRIQAALGALADHGIVIRSSSTSQRFVLPGDSNGGDRQ